MRISAVQRLSLKQMLLWAMEENRVVSNVDLRNSVRRKHDTDFLDEHFRRSCENLVKHGLFLKGKGPGLNGPVAWKITKKGMLKAREIFREELKENKE